MARERASSVASWIVNASLWQTYVSKEAKVMLALITVSCVAMLAMCLAVVLVTYTRLRNFNVDESDPSVCKGASYEEIKTNSVGYNMANTSFGCFFILWTTFRAVRLEKGALLVCVVIVIITVVARVLYFAFGVGPGSLYDSDLEVAAQGVFTAAGIIMLAAIPITFKVSDAFGWRFFTKGVTQAEDVETMQRYKQLDACAKLDLYITVNAFISLFFIVSDDTLRIFGFIVTAVTIIFLVALTAVVKRRYYFAMYAFYFVCVLMPVFYVYTVTIVVMQSEDGCSGEMRACMSRNNVAIGNCASRRCALLTTCTPYSNYNLCVNTTFTNGYDTCCSEYGRCKLKLSFFENDKPLVLFLAVAGCLVRVITVIVGYRQAQAMDIPSVQEMLKRGERNIRNFSLPTFTFLKREATAAPASAAAPQ